MSSDSKKRERPEEGPPSPPNKRPKTEQPVMSPGASQHDLKMQLYNAIVKINEQERKISELENTISTLQKMNDILQRFTEEQKKWNERVTAHNETLEKENAALRQQLLNLISTTQLNMEKSESALLVPIIVPGALKSDARTVSSNEPKNTTSSSVAHSPKDAMQVSQSTPPSKTSSERVSPSHKDVSPSMSNARDKEKDSSAKTSQSSSPTHSYRHSDGYEGNSTRTYSDYDVGATRGSVSRSRDNDADSRSRSRSPHRRERSPSGTRTYSRSDEPSRSDSRRHDYSSSTSSTKTEYVSPDKSRKTESKPDDSLKRSGPPNREEESKRESSSYKRDEPSKDARVSEQKVDIKRSDSKVEPTKEPESEPRKNDRRDSVEQNKQASATDGARLRAEEDSRKDRDAATSVAAAPVTQPPIVDRAQLSTYHKTYLRRIYYPTHKPKLFASVQSPNANDDDLAQFLAGCEPFHIRALGKAAGSYEQRFQVVFEQEEGANKAMALSGRTLQGARVIIKKWSPFTTPELADVVARPPNSSTICVDTYGAILKEDPEIIHAMLGDCGKILEIRFLRDPMGNFRGQFIVQFDSSRSAERYFSPIYFRLSS